MHSCSDQSDEDSLSEKTPPLDVSFITTSAEDSVVEEEPQDSPPQGGEGGCNLWTNSLVKRDQKTALLKNRIVCHCQRESLMMKQK